MKKSHKGLLILLTPFIVGFLLGLAVGGGCSRKGGRKALPAAKQEPVEVQEDSLADASEEPTMTEVLYHAARPPYSTWFADLNDEHLRVADSLGLRTIPKTRDDVNVRGLVRISDNDLYHIDSMRYSVPYLTKGAAAELSAIAKAFKDSLERKGLLIYGLMVTSVLRTEEDVARLQRSGNVNASDRSSHCYGTTFDITYTKYWREAETEEFMQPFELTKVLGEVLRDQKAAGRCIVKYERKEHCFHVTSLLPR